MLSYSFLIICFLALSTSVFCQGGRSRGEGSASPPSPSNSFPRRFRQSSSFGSDTNSNQNTQPPFRQTSLSKFPTELSTNSRISTPSSSYSLEETAEAQSPTPPASRGPPINKFGSNSAARFGPIASPGTGYGVGSTSGIKDTPPSSGSVTPPTPPSFQSRLAKRSGTATPTSPNYNSPDSLSAKNNNILGRSNSDLSRSNNGLARSNSRLGSEGLNSPGLSSTKSFKKSNPETNVDDILNQLENKLKSATLSHNKILIPFLEGLISNMTHGFDKIEANLDGTKYNVDLGPLGSRQRQNYMLKAEKLLNSQKETLQWISSTISQVLPQQDARRLSPSPSFGGGLSNLSRSSSGLESKSYIHDITTKNEWENKVLNNSKPVILDVWAPTCKPCKAITPIIKKLIDEQKGAVELVKINADETRLANNLGYNRLPTVEFFYKGKPVAESIIGGYPESKYRQVLEEFLNSIKNF